MSTTIDSTPAEAPQYTNGTCRTTAGYPWHSVKQLFITNIRTVSLARESRLKIKKKDEPESRCARIARGSTGWSGSKGGTKMGANGAE